MKISLIVSVLLLLSAASFAQQPSPTPLLYSQQTIDDMHHGDLARGVLTFD